MYGIASILSFTVSGSLSKATFATSLKTSRLRSLTEVGNSIEGLLYSQMTKNNIFLISEDSYYYLLQMLKLQITDGEIKIRPFIALIYMIVLF